MAHRAEVSDPRDPLSEHVLQVSYAAIPGRVDDFVGYREPHTIIIHDALTKRGTSCLVRLTPEQRIVLRERLHAQHHW